MKKLMLSTAILGAIATGAFAQGTDMSNPFRSAADPMMIPASDFIGMRVYASEAALDADEYAGLQDGWEDIGEINDVLLARDGTIDSVLVDIGGFLGMGERQVAVDMGAIRFVADSGTAEDLDDFFLVMTANRAVLEGAPAYSWGDDAAAMDATPSTDTMTADTMAADPAPQALPQTADLTAEELTGAPVYDATDAWIGEVSELVLTPEGTVSQAVVDVGGFLGLGAKPVALNMDQLQIQSVEGSDELRLQVSLTKEQLEALPEHTG